MGATLLLLVSPVLYILCLQSQTPTQSCCESLQFCISCCQSGIHNGSYSKQLLVVPSGCETPEHIIHACYSYAAQINHNLHFWVQPCAVEWQINEHWTLNMSAAYTGLRFEKAKCWYRMTHTLCTGSCGAKRSVRDEPEGRHNTICRNMLRTCQSCVVRRPTLQNCCRYNYICQDWCVKQPNLGESIEKLHS